jgi:predicted RNase H-like HicB family nuclease/predicted RNA binding protein YcfA (HicA-like mRNA interferase family)
LKVRDVIKLIEHDGWKLARTTGSHRHYHHPEKPGTVTVPWASVKGCAPRHARERFKTGRVEVKQARTYAVVFEKSATGYGAWVPDLPGCVTVGDTLPETERNIREAIQGHIEVMREHGESVPEPTTSVQEIAVEIPA